MGQEKCEGNLRKTCTSYCLYKGFILVLGWGEEGGGEAGEWVEGDAGRVEGGGCRDG